MGAVAKAYLFSCLPMLVGALMAIGALYYWRSGREFREQGVTTRGTVVSRQSYRFGRTYVVKFTDLNGTPRTVEIKVRSTRGGVISEGSTTPITYVPAHPEKAHFGLKWGAWITAWLALVVAAFGGGMVVYGLYLVFGLLTGRLSPEKV